MYHPRNPFRPVKSMTAIVLTASFLASCGGGGGGGGVAGGGVNVITPALPATTTGSDTTTTTTTATLRPPAGLTISATERRNSPGIATIGGLAAFGDGRTGRTITIGVADSGINAGHSELRGRITGGGDWQGNNNGLADPYGHGTNVAGIIAGADDAAGIQGVAPDAQIVSYRILDERGDFGASQSNSMIAELLADARARNLPVVNMSWTSGQTIDAFNRTELGSLIAGELAAYERIAAGGDGNNAVIVWAAGNDGGSETGVRGGLPHHYPELEDNWLTVVAVDHDGRQAAYSNQCGVAADWCLAAPGADVLTAATDGGYERRTGTSLAAPHVSGALAVVLDAVPGITPEGARARLLATAELRGLTAADGCTTEVCDEATMRRAFGRGMVRVDRAIAPIAPEGILTPSGRAASISDSGIIAPSLAGDSIANALAGTAAVLRDGFDGAEFAAPVSGFIAQSDTVPAQTAEPASLVYGNEGGGQAIGFMGSGSAPVDQSHPARLIDVPAAEANGWAGYRFTDDDAGRDMRVAVGFGEARNAAHLMVTTTGAEDTENAPVNWLGGGIDSTPAMLDGGGFGGFDFGGSRSTWIFAGHQRRVGKGYLTMEGLLGQTAINGNDDALIADGGMVYDSFNLGFSSRADAGDGWQVALDVPPALRSGHITVNEARRDGDKGIDFVRARHNLHLDRSHREARLALGYGGVIRDFAGVSARLTHHHNAGHRRGKTGQSVDLSVEINF